MPGADFPLGSYDVLILDYMLGRGDGLEWLQSLKQRADCPKVLFLTGAGNEIIAVRAMKAGADDYQRKQELTREKLITSLRELTADARTSARSRPTSRRAWKAIRSARKVRIPGIKVLHLIGEGGMARVYLASREDDDEPLVVKILRHEIAAEQEGARALHGGIFAGRAHPEPRTWRASYGHGNYDEHAYLVMEFFEGGDLNKRLGGQPVAPPEALRFFRELMFALGDIHEKGILHRDLKPQNLMFRARRQPRDRRLRHRQAHRRAPTAPTPARSSARRAT